MSDSIFLSLSTIVTIVVVRIRKLFILSFNEEDTSSNLSLNDDILNGLNSIFKKKELTTFNREATKFKGFMIQLKLEFKVKSKRFKTKENKVFYAASLLKERVFI